jgi:hypothetical protein
MKTGLPVVPPLPNRPWRVSVEPNRYSFDSFDVWIYAPEGNQVSVVQPIDMVCTTVDRYGAEAQERRDPSLRLPVEMAQALLDALALQFGGGSEVRHLAEQLKAERARCDKLIEHLAKSAPLGGQS